MSQFFELKFTTQFFSFNCIKYQLDSTCLSKFCYFAKQKYHEAKKIFLKKSFLLVLRKRILKSFFYSNFEFSRWNAISLDLFTSKTKKKIQKLFWEFMFSKWKTWKTFALRSLHISDLLFHLRAPYSSSSTFEKFKKFCIQKQASKRLRDCFEALNNASYFSVGERWLGGGKDGKIFFTLKQED